MLEKGSFVLLLSLKLRTTSTHFPGNWAIIRRPSETKIRPWSGRNLRFSLLSPSRIVFLSSARAATLTISYQIVNYSGLSSTSENEKLALMQIL